MAVSEQSPLLGLDEDAALRLILQGTATETGHRFFAALVENLVKALNTHGAMVTEYVEEKQQLRALAFWMDGRCVRDYVFNLPGTPCERVIRSRDLVHFPNRLLDLFPDEPGVKDFGLVSYMGMPLLDVDGGILGHLAVIDRRPMPEEPRLEAIFRIFGARAAAELQRLRREDEIREREEKLGRLVDSAMDAIIELDSRLCVISLNRAAEKALQHAAGEIVGTEFSRVLDEESRRKLVRLQKQIDGCEEGRQSLWIPGGLSVGRSGGRQFTAEATLSRFEMRRQPFYTLILRDVNDRLEAEEKIHSLTVQTEYLREELNELHNFGAIIGCSPSLVEVLKEVEQVAPTDATVLILGETGTGKELIARAIHAASDRRDKPLVKINCAAVPANLIESEFFGHEEGAFTGATKRRQGRFALADGGSVFLDEIGELPTDLQAKLLRVLQEGEFEPVGSSQTKRVDVRILAATNRDLDRAVRDGTFREDLFYRLCVFPIHVPPLRDRGDDVIRLASAFADRFARRMGRPLKPLSDQCLQRLRAYSWPGNVRELENVIERAVITSQEGRLNLARALPESVPAKPMPTPEPSQHTAPRVRTVDELQTQERDNILLALKTADWKVSGAGGAADLLGMNPSTLNSRMKAFGIRRPH